VLASLFSDSGLTTPITNPVITDAAGYPANGGNECGIYCAAGTFDVAFLTSADVVFASWDDMVPWGSESGDISRVVTGNGRFRVIGSAGSVIIEAGDPSPDDVGGDLTIRGWNGTPLDALSLESAAIDADGEFTEKGKKVTAYAQTEATVFTNVASVTIPLPNTPTGTRRYRVTVFDLLFGTDSQPNCRLTYGGVVKSGAADYSFVVNYYNVGSGPTRGSSAANSLIPLHGESLNAETTKPFVIEFDIITPDAGANATNVRWQMNGMTVEATPIAVDSHGFGLGLGGYGRCDGIQLYTTAGNITGAYVVETIRGYGD
jgi:hypothetical protein